MGWDTLRSNVQDHAKRIFGERDGAGNEGASYEPSGGVPFPILGIFRDQHVGVDSSALEVQISTQNPTLDVKLADVTSGPPDPLDRVVVRGFRWAFEAGEEDGEGMVKLHLNKVEAVP